MYEYVIIACCFLIVSNKFSEGRLRSNLTLLTVFHIVFDNFLLRGDPPWMTLFLPEPF